MGGYRSGRHSGAPVIEYGLKLDIRQLRKQGIFRPGISRWHGYSWSSGAAVTLDFDWANMEMGFASLRIMYSANGQPVDDRISLERFAQPFGGYRWYFICPGTNARCQCLYIANGRKSRAGSENAWHQAAIECGRLGKAQVGSQRAEGQHCGA